MKRCPTCNQTFSDRTLSFCTEDGTPLVPITDPPDETTAVTASLREVDTSPTAFYTPRDWQPSGYQPPGFQAPAQKRKTWPWVLGIVAVFFLVLAGLGVAAAIIIPNVIRSASNTNRAAANTENRSDNNSNAISDTRTSNANTTEVNRNTDTEEVLSSPPTDEDQVLADLTALEHEWTAANINADKKKLSRILADDYVGSSTDGKPHGKAEYLATITRDTTTQTWNFEDLKVTLKGDRATLTGVLRFQLPKEQRTYRFVDKFVWRDARWQAVGSEVTRVE